MAATKPTVVRLLVNEQAIDTLTLDDFIAIEEIDQATMRSMRELLSRFVVDEHDQTVPLDDARKQIGRLTKASLAGVIDQFVTSVKGWKDKAVPPTTP